MRVLVALSAVAALSACATRARMHTEAQLNMVATDCGLALGELIQDESEKKLLLMIRQRQPLTSASASPNGRAGTASRPCSSTISNFLRRKRGG